MSSTLAKTPGFRRALPAWCILGGLLAGVSLASLLVPGCQEGHHDVSARQAASVYPPAPQAPRVIALGTLRGEPPPSKAQVDLSMFLFGVEPPPSLALANPTDLAGRDDHLLICDSTLHAVFKWEGGSGKVTEQRFWPPLEHPVVVDIAPNGDRFVCDGVVVRADPSGEVRVKYALEADAFKPAGALTVGETVWVANLAMHRIEVFDAESGEHLRSVGEPGSESGQFNMPRGLVRTPDGNVCVVDMLNNRVQVLDTDGNWVRNIGQPETFGRPKDVAVGPDGVIFVTDALMQRVHVFAPDGQRLLVFGEPGSGVGELTLPNGVAVTSVAPQTAHELPADTSAAYYVLVAEQLNRPGVRVYAWLGNCEPAASVFLPCYEAIALRTQIPEGPAGPHWDPESCAACHEEDDDEQLLPIALDDVAELCMDCHEGHEEAPFLHPVDSEAAGAGLRTPAGWPLVDGQLSCVTCHHVKQQCSLDAKRAAATPKLLRRHDPRETHSFCMACHVDAEWADSPHRQLDADGEPDSDSCLVCHEEEPTVPSDGARQGDAKLRDASGSCWDCHARHWDYYPAEHVNQRVPPEMRQRAEYPLTDDRIACYTCHNPHQVGLFPKGSELAAWAVSPAESGHYLRADRPGLCLGCHDE